MWCALPVNKVAQPGRKTMQQVRLGRSGLVVSRLAFGTWQLGGDWGPTDTAEAIGAIRRAVDEGVTFFDTAQAYGFGQSEQLLSAALRGVPREQVVIATKGGLRLTDSGLVRDASARWIREGIDASLRALGTDYVDLYQLHWPDPATPFDETAEALAGLIAEGKIRHVGVSNFGVEQMEAFGVTLPVETLQAPYDLFPATSKPRSSPTPRRTTSGSWSMDPSPTGC